MQRIGKIFLLPSVSREGPFEKCGAEDGSIAGDDYSDDDETFKDVPLLDLPHALHTRLMEHQKIGVRWLHSLFLTGSGGILGDDMGLGKTFQVNCLLAGLMRGQSIERVLILAPVSVLPNWQRELQEHLQTHVSGCSVFMINADLPKKKRLQILEHAFQTSMRGYAPKVVLSSYQLVSNMIDDFANRGKWDYVILDEGHIIKNPSTKTSKAMHELPSRHRLILTGTPVQNNLNEFWAIANWATKGKRFGTLSSFKADFTLPIVAGQNPRATEEERYIAEVAAKNLLALTKPILLQRKKCELPASALMQLPTKVELVVWSPLATSQRVLYEEFLQSRQFDKAMHRSTCPVEVINHLKTVCRHPLLIEALEANRRRRDPSLQGQRTRPQQSQASARGEASEDEDDVDALGRGIAGMNVANGDVGEGDGEDALLNLPANATVFDVIGREPEVEELLRGSIKLRILLKLVHRLHYAGHRTLIFSQSRLMLDILQRVLAHYRFASHRIDGSVKSAERQRIIDEFNDTSDDSGVGPSICLLTTKACGFGITLTGADRVIIYDPCKEATAADRYAYFTLI
jgi:SNF2 family DNA or RNA helicase